MDLKGEISSNTIIVGDFNTPFTSMDRSYRQKIHKKALSLNDTVAQMDCMYTYVCVCLHINTLTFTITVI